MTLPSRLKIGRHWWTVELTEDWIYYGKDRCRGLCDGTKRHIMVYGKQRKKLILSTFWHEVLHAIEFSYKVKIPHHVIYGIEGAITDLLLKNPECGQIKLAVMSKRPVR